MARTLYYRLSLAAFALALLPTCAHAQTNFGEQKSSPDLPFTVTKVATFDLPWRIAFLPDARMLITEKPGGLWLVSQDGTRIPVSHVPAVLLSSQGGMMGVYTSPHYSTDHLIYLTYAEPNDGGSSLAMARAKLVITGTASKGVTASTGGTASLEGLEVLWHDPMGGRGGQFGAAIAFSPDGRFLYLSSGDRQRMTPAQDPNQPIGKILRLTLDGKPAPGNPMAGKTGAASIDVINPPSDTEKAKTAPVVKTYTFTAPNLTPSETWASGVRTPYGLAFAPDGRLWELEHGPRGGDELNLIEAGRNYGWPLVSYATNYNGVPIASPDTRDDLAKPVIYWTPVIAPGNMVFYKGAMFSQWNGNALIGGMGTESLLRITFDGKGGATSADRWAMGFRVRDVAVGPDGALWVIEDSKTGGLYKLVKK